MEKVRVRTWCEWMLSAPARFFLVQLDTQMQTSEAIKVPPPRLLSSVKGVHQSDGIHEWLNRMLLATPEAAIHECRR